MDIRDKIKGLVEYQIRIHPEYDSPEGHFYSVDNQDDKAICDKIRNDLEFNEFAWCCIEVRCYYKNELFGNDYVGGCSYESQKDFMENGYYEDMKDQALDALCAKLEKLQIKE